jgi:hypothetical protein
MTNSSDVFKQSFDKSMKDIPKIEPEVMLGMNKMKDEMSEDEILKGGLSDNKSLEDLAKKHKVDLDVIKKQFEIGIDKEQEHTKDSKEAEEIAMDHLWEDPKYYEKLSKIEKKETKEGTSTQNEKDMVDGIIEIVKQVEDSKNRKSIAKNMIEKLKKEKVDFDHEEFLELCGIGSKKNTETKEATGSGSSGAYSAPLFSGEEPKKVEATEATGSGSVGAYESPAAWAKSTKKKDWRGKSHTQIPGGAFVSVKKKCKSFPYCNKGDINALHIYENKMVQDAIDNVSKKLNISETTIKAIIEFELEKVMKQLK